MPDRRTQIAQAGVRIISSQGVRSLTHRAVDAELGLPAGSTSYYARTRRELIGLIAAQVAQRTQGELIGPRLPATVTPAVLADELVEALAASARASAEQRVRLLLLLEYPDDPELQAVLATSPETRRAFLTTATAVLELLEVEAPDDHAADLVALLEALLVQRVLGAPGVDERRLIAAYLQGLPRVETEPERAGINPAATARNLLSRIRRTR